MMTSIQGPHSSFWKEPSSEIQGMYVQGKERKGIYKGRREGGNVKGAGGGGVGARYYLKDITCTGL